MSLCISVFISFATHEPAHNLQGGLLVQCSALWLSRIRGSSAGGLVEAAEKSVRVFSARALSLMALAVCAEQARRAREAARAGGHAERVRPLREGRRALRFRAGPVRSPLAWPCQTPRLPCLGGHSSANPQDEGWGGVRRGFQLVEGLVLPWRKCEGVCALVAGEALVYQL